MSTLPGRPIWMDLMTHDTAGAMAFYGELFGWTFEDQGEAFGHYTLASAPGGGIVAGLMSTLMSPEGPAEEPQSPTTWSIYLHTDDLDAALARVPETGGQVLFGPMDVADHGRQAFVIDPAGAGLGLWQPGRITGFEWDRWKLGAPGTPVWFETLTNDFDATLPFYRDVTLWDVSWMSGEDGGFRYVTDGAGDDAVAGLCDAASIMDPGHTSFWRAYIAVTDVDATAQRVVDLGGAVQEAPADSPFGRFAQVADPQGAVFMINSNPYTG